MAFALTVISIAVASLLFIGILLLPIWGSELLDYLNDRKLAPLVAESALRKSGMNLEKARDRLIDDASYSSISRKQRFALDHLDNVYEKLKTRQRIAEIDKMLENGTL